MHEIKNIVIKLKIRKKDQTTKLLIKYPSSNRQSWIYSFNAVTQKLAKSTVPLKSNQWWRKVSDIVWLTSPNVRLILVGQDKMSDSQLSEKDTDVH